MYNFKHNKFMKKTGITCSFFRKRGLIKILKIMKLTLLLTTLAILQINATVYSQNTLFTIKMKDRPVKDVFKEIESRSEFRFFYNDELLNSSETVSLNAKDQRVEEILEILLSDKSLSYTVLEDNLIVITPTSAFKQGITITGKVTDADNNPLPGVNIVVEGTTTGAVTDLDGNYTISVPGEDATLVFSFVGYLTEQIAVNGQTEINVSLAEDIQSLDEVIVIGYGTQKKSDLTAAIASIDAEDLPRSASMSINNMIQGRVPGVEIVPVNGMPGAGVSIKVRGVSTINNSEPLYVIDGVQIRNSPGSSSNTLSMINPNDIERIEILKDAASTAIYGAGGANGVVLITTKKGSKGKPRINFNTSYGIATTPKHLEVLKADAYVDLLTEQLTAANPNSPIDEVVGANLLNENYSRVDRTDWEDEVFRGADLYQADLSVGGGTEFSNYMFSMGYADQEAIVIGGNYTRYTMRLATDFKIGNRIEVGQNFNASYANRRDIGGAGRNYITGALRMAPYVPIYDDSNWWGFGNNNNVNDNNNADNPFTDVEYRNNKHKNFLFIGNIYGKLEIIKGLNYLATVSVNYDQHHQNDFMRAHVNSNEAQDERYNGNYSWSLWPLFEQTLTFNRTFNDHSLTMLGGMTVARYGESRSLSISGTNFPNENLTNILLAQDNLITNENIGTASSLSYFGRLNYGFANKYLLTAIIRRDGSDKFASGNRWGTFPSISAAWKLHEEDFLKSSLPAVSNMKIRAGWGVVGIDAIDRFQYLSLIHSKGMSYPVGVPGGETYLSGATIKALASPDIKWEEATTTNIGLDLGLFNNQITFTADYFTKETEDILVEVPTSPSMGLGLTGGGQGGSRVANAATTENSGIELLLGYNNYSGSFKYGISANFTYVDNEVTNLGQGEPITGPSYNGQAHMTFTDIGQPIGSFYGYRVDKIYANQDEIDADNADVSSATGGETEFYQSDLTSPGDIRFKDLDGNGFIDDEDREFIGSPIPKYTYGLAFDAEYSGFDFSLNLSGIAGVDIYSAYYTWNLLGMRLTSNHLTDVKDRWTPSNTNTDMPRAIANDPNNNLRTSDRYVYDGSFMKIRNIALGYTLPASMTNGIGISSLRLYTTIQNALTLSDYVGYDPEVSSYNENDASGYNLGRGIDRGFTPNPRTFLFGVEVSF